MTTLETKYTDALTTCIATDSVELKLIYSRTLDADLIKAAAAVADTHAEKFRPSPEAASLPFHKEVDMAGADPDVKEFCTALGFKDSGKVALPGLPDLAKLAEIGFIGLDPTSTQKERIKLYGAFLHVLVFASVSLGNVSRQNLNVTKMVTAINEFAKSKTGYKYSPTGRAIAATLQLSFKSSTSEALRKFGILLLSSAYGLLLTIMEQKPEVKSLWYSSFETVGSMFINVAARNSVPDIVAKARVMMSDNVAMTCCGISKADINKLIVAKYGSPDFKTSPLGTMDVDVFDRIRAWSSFTNLLGASPELARSNQAEKYAAYKAAKEEYESQMAARQTTGRVRRGR